MDPERFVAHRYENGSLIQTGYDTLDLPGGGSVPFSTEKILGELREALEEPS
jgi:hypothetical protein